MEVYLLKSFDHLKRREKSGILPANRNRLKFDKWKNSTFKLSEFEKFIDIREVIEHPCCMEILDNDHIVVVGQHSDYPNDYFFKGAVIDVRDGKVQERRVLPVNDRDDCYINIHIRKTKVVLTTVRRDVMCIGIDKWGEAAKPITGHPKPSQGEDLICSQLVSSDDKYFIYVTESKQAACYSLEDNSQIPLTEIQRVNDVVVKYGNIYVLSDRAIHVFSPRNGKNWMEKPLENGLAEQWTTEKNLRMAVGNKHVYICSRNYLEAYIMIDSKRRVIREIKNHPRLEVSTEVRDERISNVVVLSNKKSIEIVMLVMRKNQIAIYALVANKLNLVTVQSYPQSASSSRTFGVFYVPSIKSLVTVGDIHNFNRSRISF